MNKAWGAAVAIAAAAAFCALLFAIVFHRQILDAILLYSFYLQPKELQEAQCGSNEIKSGFDECWAPHFDGPRRAPASFMCWEAALRLGVCGKQSSASASCMGRIADTCERLAGGR